MSQSESKMANFLENHPRWIGVLFTMTLLLMEAGMAAGANGSSTVGP